MCIFTEYEKLFGMVKGGAENLFKNIKDTSSKMMHTVAGLVHLHVVICVFIFLLFLNFFLHLLCSFTSHMHKISFYTMTAVRHTVFEMVL